MPEARPGSIIAPALFVSILILALALLAAACARPAVVPSPAATATATAGRTAATSTPAQPSPVPSSTRTPAAAPSRPDPTRTPTHAARPPSFGHVFIIVMENKDASDIVDNKLAPYISSLAKKYGSAAGYYAVSHPSLPNYLALTGGSTFGISSDCTDCFVSAPNIADLIERSGRTWKSYIESMPQPCYLGADTKLYALRHNPFLYYDNVRNNPARCHKIVPLTQLDADLSSKNVPDYVWITPNLCNDMHDCPVSTGDAWLRIWVPKIMSSQAWKDDAVLFLTFDEGTTNDGCCRYAAGGKISTLVISNLAKPGFVSHVAYNHYSLLRTIQEAWGLSPLLGDAACDCSLPMTEFFKPR